MSNQVYIAVVLRRLAREREATVQRHLREMAEAHQRSTYMILFDCDAWRTVRSNPLGGLVMSENGEVVNTRLPLRFPNCNQSWSQSLSEEKIIGRILPPASVALRPDGRITHVEVLPAGLYVQAHVHAGDGTPLNTKTGAPL